MKTRWIVLTLFIATAAGFGGWFLAKRQSPEDRAAEGGSRKVAFYQSAMHPWIKSEQPGNCTICGMKLTPVYEGEKGFDVAGDIITLPTNTVNVIHVRTAPVQRETVTRTLIAPGAVAHDETTRRTLSAYVGGRIDELRVNYPGAVVRKGELLARIYSPELLTAEREYLALLSGEEPQGNDALAADRQRLREAAEQRLRRLGLSGEQIRGLANKAATNSLTDVLAPFDGTVLERFVFEGQYVMPGERLFELADLSRVWLEFAVYEQDLALVKVGTPVRFTTPATGTNVYEGVVSFIDPQLNPQTRAATARVELPNSIASGPNTARYEFYLGLYADGVFEVSVTNALAVPRTSVISSGAGPVVYVEVGEGSYEQRKVRLGFRGEKAWEVLEGVSEGEKVVVNGAMLIDSQAQLNQQASLGVTPHEHAPVQQPAASSHVHSSPKVSAITEQQEEALERVIAGASELARVLAADDLAGYNKAAAQFGDLASHLTHVFSAEHEWAPAIRAIVSRASLKQAASLAEARAQFLPLSNALAELARAGRAVEPFASSKVYRCPMADKAVAGAPKNSFWVQLEGPLRNPFFGSEMLTCGSEVKP